MPDEFPTTLRSGTADDELIDQHIATMVVGDMKNGIAQMRHYESGHRLPIGVGGYNEHINDDDYVVMYFGIVCRPRDAERFLQEEFKPCYLDAVQRITKDAPGIKKTS